MMIKKPRVVFVGGVERVERSLRASGEELGVDVDVHAGHMQGNAGTRLAALVRRADLVVLVTGVNSHNAVHTAKKEAARSGTPLQIMKFCGASVARALIAELARSAAA